LCFLVPTFRLGAAFFFGAAFRLGAFRLGAFRFAAFRGIILSEYY